MGGLFRFDGPFFKYGTLLCDLMILSILWCVCSLPLITMGPASAALYYVTTRLISAHEGYVTKDFFKSFAGNLIQAGIAGIIFIAFGIIIFFNINHLRHSTGIWNILLVLQYVFALESIITFIYVFPIIARFKMKLFDIFKMAFFMANKHIFTTITCLALFGSVLFVCFYVYPVMSLFLLPGAYAYLTSFMIMRLFKKYVPEMDADISEDGKNILEEKHKQEKEEEMKREKEMRMAMEKEKNNSDSSLKASDSDDSNTEK